MAEADAPRAAAAGGSKGETTRREFLERIPWITTAWVALTAAVAGALTASLRFLYPNVLYEPPQQFKIGLPTDFQVGTVSTSFKDRYGVWVIRTSDGFYALTTICTHLGCTPNWLATEGKFKCPCHGSGFYMSGINFEGPAPRPLERAAIFMADDGQLQVDKSQTFLFEQGGWDDPASFFPYTG